MSDTPSNDETRSVEQRGRQQQKDSALLRLVTALGVVLGLWLTAWFGAGPRLNVTFWLVAGTLVAVLSVVAIGRVAANTVGSRVTASDRHEPDGPQQGGTVICCSGGGIKSASFCLGALQALAEPGLEIYQNANAVVGVSGGGYAAAAYWTATGPGREPPFQRNSTELLELRDRTNYLASSARVRFELYLSLVSGLVTNFAIFASVCVLAIDVLANYASDLKLGTAAVSISDSAPVRSTGDPWSYGPGWGWLLASAPALPLLVAALALFIRDRAKANSPDWERRWSSRAPINFWSNLPNKLAATGLAWLIAVPGCIVLAVATHNISRDPGLVWRPAVSVAGFVSAGVTAWVMKALVTSAVRGLTTTPDTSTTWGRALTIFRQAIAARLALTILGLLVGIGFICALSYAMTGDIYHGATGVLAVAGPFAVLAIAGFGLTANATSLHVFYRDRLVHAYLDHPLGTAKTTGRRSLDDAKQAALPWRVGFTKNSTAPAPSTVDAIGDARPSTGQEGQLPDPSTGSHPNGSARSAPALVLCATVNVMDQELVPVGRNGTPFVMSETEIGLTDTHLSRVSQRHTATGYHHQTGWELTVAQAVAISGAAVAPVAGREGRLRRYRVLFALANIRLGVWLPSPYWDLSSVKGFVMRFDRFLNRPSGLKVWTEAFSRIRMEAPWLYVTDGGHYDNLGILEALRRRPDRIIVLDGSGDAENQFPTIGRAIATARMDSDITFTFDPQPMMREPGTTAPPQSSVTSHAHYPGNTPSTTIHYLKCVMPTTAPWDLQAYQLQNSDFPATSSSLEMYDEFDFEAFHQLGYQVVCQAGLQADLRAVTTGKGSNES